MSDLSTAAQRSNQLSWFTCDHCDQRRAPTQRGEQNSDVCKKCEAEEKAYFDNHGDDAEVERRFTEVRDNSLRQLRRDGYDHDRDR